MKVPLRSLKRDWEDLANVDPLWAILTHPAKKFSKWDVDEFFRTGAQEIERVMESAARLGHPSGREAALDFGCGVGRLTRALAKDFRRCCGVDISERMIVKARELNRSLPGCEFVLNTQEDLALFPDDHFDMIYTCRVLQHIPSRATIKRYIAEFVRTLKQNGLLVFQLLSYMPLRNTLQPRRRLYALLRGFGISERFLYALRLHPISATFIPEEEVRTLLNQIGAKVLEVHPESVPGTSRQSRTYYVTK